MLAGECDVISTEMDGHVHCLKSVLISNMGEVDLPWVNYRQIFMRIVLKDRKKIQISAAGGNLVFFYIASFLTLPPVLGVVSVPAVNHEVGTASYIFELGSGLLLSLYVCSFISPPTLNIHC